MNEKERAAVEAEKSRPPIIGRKKLIAVLEKQLLGDTRTISRNATVIGDIAADLADAILARLGGVK